MTWCIKVEYALACSLFALSLSAQSLTGVIDIHAHHDPDSVPRSIDAIDLAKLAKSRGMRGLVLKNHYEPTASLAYIVRKEVPGIEIFGGISLDLTVGGVNPAAVEHMTHVKGGWGRVVWMPTFDAENQVRYDKANRPYASVSKNGQLLPEVNQVLALIAKHKLTMATGHSSAEECLMLIRAAKDLGVTSMVVTHAMEAPIRMTIPQMKQAAAMGAYIEFVYHPLIDPKSGLAISDYVAAIRAGQRRHAHPREFARYRVHGFRIALRSDGKSRFENIHAQFHQLGCHAEFFRHGHAATRRLLPVT